MSTNGSMTIAFHEERFVPLIIEGNAEKPSDKQTAFFISSADGPGRARVKSLIVATGGLIQAGAEGGWSPNVQAMVIKCLEDGPELFEGSVDGVLNFTVPCALAKKVGLLAEYPQGMVAQSPYSIRTGHQYARVASYWPMLAFEVAMAIARISAQAHGDPRFFDWLRPLLAIDTGTSGTAPSVPSAPVAVETVDEKTQTDTHPNTTSVSIQ